MILHDSFGEIGFVSVARVNQTSLEVENGVIINVLINDAGQGYINVHIQITDQKDCRIRIYPDANGSTVNIINGGRDYIQSTINVRSPLVKSDESTAENGV